MIPIIVFSKVRSLRKSNSLISLDSLNSLRALMVLAAVALTACTTDEPAGTGDRLTFFTRMDAPATRATIDNTWSGGEEVQVSINGESAVTFTAATDGVLTPNDPLYWQSTSQTLSARAWHPAGWTMQANQSTVENYRAADFIFAPTVSDISLGNASSTPLTFSHKMAKVTATLTAGTGISDVSGATVAFYGYASGSANTSDGTLSGSSNGWIQSRNSSGHMALLIPQQYQLPIVEEADDVAGLAFIKVMLGGFDYVYRSVTEINLEAGKSYTFNITVNKTSLSVTSSVSPSWDEGTTEGLTAVPAYVLALGGIAEGATVTVKYTDNTEQILSMGSNDAVLWPSPSGDKIIRSIQINGGPEILIGRKEGDLTLKFDEAGNLIFREADTDGNIPIGAYAEFQLINTATGGLAGQYKQEADLDLMNVEWMPIGISEQNSFTGAFDGGGYTLANLTINQPDKDCIGLFGYIDTGSVLSNIAVASGSVSGHYYIGGVCGQNTSSTIIACSNQATVSGLYYIGGVCGLSQSVIENYPVGFSTITACYNAGSVLGTVAGGVCGQSNGTTITACYNTGSVSGSNGAGGVCGMSQMVGGREEYDEVLSSTITACYNTGSVSGSSEVGGVCGENYRSTITACYNSGSVEGQSYVGGVCGENDSGTVTACYWKDVSDDNASYGIGNTASDDGAAKFSSAWPSESTHDAWKLYSNGGYWKSLGYWDAVTPVYPKLWFEE
jgi:hypothetical protein